MAPPAASDDAVSQVKARLNLLDVVGRHVRLRKQGREHVGLCPFHEERTPSFTLNEQLQSWYCFGCQRGGDLFTFVELIEKTDFRGALTSLAELAGVELAAEAGPDRERARLRRRVLDMNLLAAQYYEYVLHSTPAGEPGRELLRRREVDEATARRFGLGFAPVGDNFAQWLRRRGRPVADAVAARLLRGDGRDWFQERLLVPIRDERGQVLAFTGRTVREGEPRKYVNTPESPVYVKGRVLFALDLAREAIGKEGQAVLMEGQFDVIAAHRHGIANAVASSGTALTEDQVRLLRRFTEEVVLVFDADQAGKSAAFKAIEQAARQGLRTSVAVLKDAKDPDELLRAAGPEAPARWAEVLRDARPGWEFWIREAIGGVNPGRLDEVEAALGRVNSVLAKIPEPALRETYRQHAANWLQLDPRLMSLNVAAERPRPLPAPSQPATGLARRPEGKKLADDVRFLLSILAVRPDALQRVRSRLRPEEDLDGDDRATYLRMVETLERGGLEALVRELAGYPAEEQDLVRRAWASPPPDVDDSVVDDVVQNLRRRSIKRRHRALRSELAEAERRGDGELVATLEAELRKLVRA